MVANISIKNYKSIRNMQIDLGRINVFIGENGCGKSNILEAIAIFCAGLTNDLKTEQLFNRGIRVTRPSLTFNSFIGKKQESEIEIKAQEDSGYGSLEVRLINENINDIFSIWDAYPNIPGVDTLTLNNEFIKKIKSIKSFENYLIYNINSNALRGFSNQSLQEPLGINGENLDVLLSTFSVDELEEINSFNFINWLENIEIDTSDNFKLKGYKLGRSTSRLYFTDKYMQEDNRLFSAENANEGALHVLFYLALFISKYTPSFFAIDNIETALNPQLCRSLMTAIQQLALKHNKQALITTHNPAVLDGLNLFDENQRLFVVKRADDGQTIIDRIRAKPIMKDGNYKLSESWTRGHIGGIPNNF